MKITLSTQKSTKEISVVADIHFFLIFWGQSSQKLSNFNCFSTIYFLILYKNALKICFDHSERENFRLDYRNFDSFVGKIGEDRVGIFPANFVTTDDTILNDVDPIRIEFEEFELKEVIGVGGFGKGNSEFNHQ